MGFTPTEKRQILITGAGIGLGGLIAGAVLFLVHKAWPNVLYHSPKPRPELRIAGQRRRLGACHGARKADVL